MLDLVPTKLPKIVKTQVGMMAQEDERWKGVRLFKLLKKKAKKCYEKVTCFKIHGLVDSHGPS